MLDPYAVLGVPADADDGAIRRRYLELARTFPPEQHPARFAAVRAAYEQVKDVGARARHRLFGGGKGDPVGAVVEEAACRTPRRRIGLAALLAALPP
ncbi:MAG: J domain-containing protein [Gemmataceae bacterium]|nr:J domain-containing protein [Gemmataceae bacterium]